MKSTYVEVLEFEKEKIHYFSDINLFMRWIFFTPVFLYP